MTLIAKNITYRPDEEFHLNDISFEMNKGELYTLLGRTLSGKTTLLKTIAGLQPFDSGVLLYDDQRFDKLPVWQRNVAMVYQQFINYPHLTVYENIAFPLKQRKLAARSIDEQVRQSIKTVGLGGFENRKIHQLSGGQQQRVALARSFAKKARIMLLDEPLVNLDYKLREQLRDEFKNLFSAELSSESILIYSSTDPLEAMQLNGHTIVMDEGRILQHSTAKDVFENPATIKVAEITNDPVMNTMRGSISEQEIVINSDFKLKLPDHFKNLSPGSYIFGIRAAELTIHENGIPFTLEFSEISGSETFLHLENNGVSLVALMEDLVAIDAHQKLMIDINVDQMYAFDMEGQLVKSPFQE